MRYFTSDTHFGHRLMTRLRGFEDNVTAHDAAIVEKWNSLVTPKDDVYILGDLTLKNPASVADLVKSLNGNLKLILGNHDMAHPLMRGYESKFKTTLELFDYVGTAGSLRVDGETILMSHFPYTGDHTESDRYDQWRLRDTGQFLLHGHTHKESRQDVPNMLHVGWDAWGQPVSESQVMTYFNRWRAQR